MGKKFEIAGNDISDGYHTFGELYEHRCLLFINLCLKDRNNSWWKRQHLDDWDCLYWDSPSGQISYHIPTRMRGFYGGVIKEYGERIGDGEIPEYDGHSSSDVLYRLKENALSWSSQ